MYVKMPVIAIGIVIAFAAPFLAVACWLIRSVVSDALRRVESVPRSIPVSGWAHKRLESTRIVNDYRW